MVHPCSNKTSYWWITPIVIKSPVITKQRIGASPLLTYPGQTACLSPVEFLTGLFREITEPLYRTHDTPSCG